MYYFITGASGSGKTTALKILEEQASQEFAFYYFDSVGVPVEDEMTKQYGSGENWQRAMTIYWAKKMKNECIEEKSPILDGQMRISFIIEACQEAGIGDYRIILFDCSDEVRRNRLVRRGHPELATEDMMNWARFLRNEAVATQSKVIDTSKLTEEESVNTLRAIL